VEKKMRGKKRELEEQKLIVPSVIKPGSSPKEINDETVLKESKPAIKNTTSAKNNLKEEWKEATPENTKEAIQKEEKAAQKNIATITKGSNSQLLKEDNNNYKTIAYTVKPGDNLGYIAAWFHCNVKEIRRWNDLSGNYIDVKDELLLYVHKNDYKKFVRFNYLSKNIKDGLSAKIITQEEADANAKTKEIKAQTPLIDKINPVKILSKKDCFQTHKIKDGETLWSIAQKYDEVTVQDIMQWNGYKKIPVLHKGDEIKVRKVACK
jgi:LysM repeat protein